jgi:hypothetical protein
MAMFLTSAIFAALTLGLGIGREVSNIQQNSKFWSELDTGQLTDALINPGAFYSVAGNLNLKCGGVVWPEHALFYELQPETEVLLPAFASAYARCLEK